jgi:MATE family multidrug resistance protein
VPVAGEATAPALPVGELRAQVALAIPLVGQQLGFQLMGLVDAALLGRWSDAALAGATVGNNLLFAITALGLGVVMGLDTVIPQRLGAGRDADARRALTAGLRLAVGVGAVLTAVAACSTGVLGLAGVEPAVRDEAQVYTIARALGITPYLAGVAMRSYLAARGVTRPLIVAVVAGNLANLGLDVVLIYGAQLGVIGAATATFTVQVLTLVLYRVAVRAVDRHSALPFGSAATAAAPAPHRDALRADAREISHYGLPVGGQICAEVGIFGVATVLAGRLGTLAAAGHGIALGMASLTFSVAVGIGSATSVRVGHAIGAGDVALARRRGVIGFGTGLIAMGAFALVLLAAPQPIAAVFTDDPAVIRAAMPLLMIAALFQLSDGTQAIGAGALRGLGDTRATLVANLIGHYFVGLPISLSLAFAVGLGAPGLWWGLSAGLFVTAVALVVRFVARTRTA